MATNDLRRIVPYVRPFMPELSTMLLGVLGAQIVAAFIPIVIAHVIDRALVHRHVGSLAPLSAIVLLLGIAEALLLFWRRFVLARTATTMEMRMREDLYAHLQRLSIRFHDDWQSGQLLSRAMTDANLIFREFVSFGAIFFIANTVMLVVVGVLLVTIQPLVATLVLLPAIPIVVLSRRFRERYQPASRVLQDRTGDLATFVEEAALGTKTITTFGRQAEVSAQFRDLASDVRTTAMRAVEIKARFSAKLGLVPNLTLAAVLAGGVVAVSHHALTVGGLVAFISLIVMMVWQTEMLSAILSLTHESAAAAQRIYEIFDAEPHIVDNFGSRTLGAVTGQLSFVNVSFT